jgi:hypothetical protein
MNPMSFCFHHTENTFGTTSKKSTELIFDEQGTILEAYVDGREVVMCRQVREHLEMEYPQSYLAELFERAMRYDENDRYKGNVEIELEGKAGA